MNTGRAYSPGTRVGGFRDVPSPLLFLGSASEGGAVSGERESNRDADAATFPNVNSAPLTKTIPSKPPTKC